MRFERCAPTATKTASKWPSARSATRSSNSMRAADVDTEFDDARDFSIEHIARQAIRRDAIAHHAPRQGAGVANLHCMPAPCQVICGGESAGPCADDEYALAARSRRHIEFPGLLECEVTEKALNRMNRYGAVEFRPVACGFAGVIADTSVDRREGVVGRQLEPGIMVAPGLGVSQPRLDVLSGRTARVARWEQVDIDRLALPRGPGIGTLMDEIRQWRDIPGWSGHARHSACEAGHEVPESPT